MTGFLHRLCEALTDFGPVGPHELEVARTVVLAETQQNVAVVAGPGLARWGAAGPELTDALHAGLPWLTGATARVMSQ